MRTDRPAAEPGETARIKALSALVEHIVVLQCRTAALTSIRILTSLTPAAPTALPFVPRDLYPLGPGGDPLRADGKIEASQRGLNAGLLYFQIARPAFGNIFYLQNLTALGDYFRATDTKPDAVVGGTWPEIGFLLPTPSQHGRPDPKQLAPGRSEEHTSELQSPMSISYSVFCLKKTKSTTHITYTVSS